MNLKFLKIQKLMKKYLQQLKKKLNQKTKKLMNKKIIKKKKWNLIQILTKKYI